MKNLFTKGLAFLTLTSVILFISCKDDDSTSNNITGGTLTIGTTTEDINNMLFSQYGESSTGVYSVSLDFVSTPNNTPIANLYIEAYSSLNYDLAEGTYTFSEFDPFGGNEAFTIEYAEATFDMIGEDYVEVVDGMFTVTKDGDYYEISFEGITTEGVTVMANYRGQMLSAYDGESLTKHTAKP